MFDEISVKGEVWDQKADGRSWQRARRGGRIRVRFDFKPFFASVVCYSNGQLLEKCILKVFSPQEHLFSLAVDSWGRTWRSTGDFTPITSQEYVYVGRVEYNLRTRRVGFVQSLQLWILLSDIKMYSWVDIILKVSLTNPGGGIISRRSRSRRRGGWGMWWGDWGAQIYFQIVIFCPILSIFARFLDVPFLLVFICFVIWYLKLFVFVWPYSDPRVS